MHHYYTSVAALQRKLRDLLTEELGFFSNGQQAIFVEPPAAPKGQVTGGCQCIITRYRNVLNAEPLLNEQGGESFEWFVVLTLHDLASENLAKYDAALTKMRHEFPLRRETSINWSDQALPQTTFRLAQYDVFDVESFNSVAQ